MRLAEVSELGSRDGGAVPGWPGAEPMAAIGEHLSGAPDPAYCRRMGMRWLLVAALALVGACATQQALRETDRRMDEIALRVAAVESTSQQLASAQPEQARVQAETIARLQAELVQARARITQLETGGGGFEARLGALERRAERGDEQLRAVAREILDRFDELVAKVTELEATPTSRRVEPPRPVVLPRSQLAPAARPAPRLVPGAEADSPPAGRCCKRCTKGIPCGNTCIAAWKTCHKGPGCAC